MLLLPISLILLFLHVTYFVNAKRIITAFRGSLSNLVRDMLTRLSDLCYKGGAAHLFPLIHTQLNPDAKFNQMEMDSIVWMVIVFK